MEAKQKQLIEACPIIGIPVTTETQSIRRGMLIGTKAEHTIAIVSEFRALLQSKQRQGFLDWLVKAEAMRIPKLNTFVAGLKKDVDVVLNAVEPDCSNGLAEGAVNKIKVIKRIMYGRCHFDTLRNKCLLAQYLAWIQPLLGKNQLVVFFQRWLKKERRV